MADGKEPVVDENELSDLLQNTLNDFCKIYDNPKEPKQPKNEEPSSKDDRKGEDDVYNQEPFVKLYESDPQFRETLKNMIKEISEPINDEDDLLQESLLSGLNEISKKAIDIGSKTEESIENEQLDFAKIMAAISGDDPNLNDSDKENAFKLNKIMPLMSNIMENLLSKDFLYPTLADLKLKYPEYLKENQETIAKNDLVRYQNQYDVIVQICQEFENETKNDDQEIKTKRFNRILALMQTMQSFGTPPPDLVAGNTFQPPPDINQQCCIV